MSSDLRTRRHCTFLMHVHLVFVAKYRRKVFTKPILNDLEQIFSKVCSDFESELVEFDGEHDIFCILLKLHPWIDNGDTDIR